MKSPSARHRSTTATRPEDLAASHRSTSGPLASSLTFLCGFGSPDLTPLPPGSPGSPSGAGCGFDAAPLEHHQVGGTVAARHAGPLARPDLVPVVAGFGAARAAGVVHGAVFTLGG